MSFATELTSKFDLVDRHSVEKRKSVEEFIQLLRERAFHEETYAKGLDRIGNHTYFVATQGTLAHAISAMKNDCLNKSMQAKLLAENIHSDLVESLKTLVKAQTQAIKKSSTEGKRLNKDLESLRDKHNKAYARYWRACKDSEELTILLEEQRDMPAERRVKALSKLVMMKKEVDESVRQYQNSIEAYNIFRKHYDELMVTSTQSKILEIYQRQEEARLEGMKDSLRKLVVYETASLRNLQYDIDNLAHAMESVNIKSDIRLFIEQNQSTGKESPLVFVPYQGTHPAFTGLGPAPPMVTLPHASARGASDLSPAQLDAIVEKAWSGAPYDSEDEANFRAAVKEPAGRRIWAESITSRRLAGRFSLSKPALELVTEQVLQILTDGFSQHDAGVVKVVIAAASSFYCEIEDSKVFLLGRIAQHPAWQQPLYWEQAIEIAIEEDMKRGNGNIESIRNAAFCQLGSFAHSMLTFSVDKLLTNELISKLACKYDLPDEDLTTLSDIVLKSNEVQRGVPTWLEQIQSHVPDTMRVKSVAAEETEEHKAEETEKHKTEETEEHKTKETEEHKAEETHDIQEPNPTPVADSSTETKPKEG